MVFPIGVSGGDFLAIVNLTGKIVSELKKNGEAPAKYQNLIIELETLGRALSRLYKLKPAQHELTHLDAIRAAATACRRPLETFLAALEKFEKSLGVWDKKEQRYKKFLKRLQYNVAFEKDVKELRTTLSGHVSTINISLMTQTLESVSVAETDRSAYIESVKDRRLALDAALEDIEGRQEETNTRLSTHTGDMGTLQETMSQNLYRVGESQIKLDEQRKTLEEIQEEFGKLKDRLGEMGDRRTSSSPAEPSELDKPTMALGLASRILALVLSGSMIVSGHTLATQAREMSKLTEQLAGDVSKTHGLASQPLDNPINPAERTEDFINMSNPLSSGGANGSVSSRDRDTGAVERKDSRKQGQNNATSSKGRSSRSRYIPSERKTCKYHKKRSRRSDSGHIRSRSSKDYSSDSDSSDESAPDESVRHPAQPVQGSHTQYSRGQRNQSSIESQPVYDQNDKLWGMLWTSSVEGKQGSAATQKITRVRRPHRMSKLAEDVQPTPKGLPPYASMDLASMGLPPNLVMLDQGPHVHRKRGPGISRELPETW